MGEPDSRMSVEPHSFDAAYVSSATQRCIPWRFYGRVACRAVASRRRKFRRLRQSSGWNLELQRRTCCPKTTKLGGNPLHTKPVLQLTRKVKRIRKRRGTIISISTYRPTHRTTWKPSSPWSRKSMENNQTILWNIWMWIWLSGNVHEYHSSSSSSSRKSLWHEFEICKESPLENNRTKFQGNRSWSVVRQKPLA